YEYSGAQPSGKARTMNLKSAPRSFEAAPSPFRPEREAPGSFPAVRMRRTRQSAWSRALVRETALSPANLIWPIFVIDGEQPPQPIASMPGVFRLSISRAVEAAREAAELGIPAIALFPYTEMALRDERA